MHLSDEAQNVLLSLETQQHPEPGHHRPLGLESRGTESLFLAPRSPRIIGGRVGYGEAVAVRKLPPALISLPISLPARFGYRGYSW